MKWSEEKVKQLHTLAAVGKSNKEIAQQLGVGINDVYAKRSQLGITIDKVRAAQTGTAKPEPKLPVAGGPTYRDRLIAEICAERERQDKKWGFPQLNTYCEWSSILAEETGELAKELNELTFGRGDVNKMLSEAVQVAAVALAIMEHEDIAKRMTEKLFCAREL